jgi:hypothetical protein
MQPSGNMRWPIEGCIPFATVRDQAACMFDAADRANMKSTIFFMPIVTPPIPLLSTIALLAVA